MIKYTNNASSTLAGAITDVATSLAVFAGDGLLFPVLSGADYFVATLEKLSGGGPLREIVKVTGRSSDTFTIVRAQEGTTALAFSGGDKIDLRITAAGLNAKADLTGAAFTGPVTHADQIVSGALLKDCAIAYNNAAALNVIDYTNGSHQRWAPGTGAQALSITNWPPSGSHGELLIEGVNLGAATITTSVAFNYLKADGTFATTTSMNLNHGATLQAAGIDFVLLWTRDGGTTIYAKVLR